MPAGTAPFDLNKVGGRKDRPEKTEVEYIGAIVPCGHHAHRHTDSRLAGFISRQEISGSQQVVIGKVNCKLLSIRNL